MTSFHSERVVFKILTFEKIADHSVHLLLKSKMTNIVFSLQVYSSNQEKKMCGRWALQALSRQTQV